MSDLLGYALKRAQLKLYEDFLKCVAPLQLTPAQFSVLLLLEKNPGRNQTEVAGALGILRPNFVAMLDGLESRGLCARTRSATDRRSHVLSLTEKGRAVLARAKKLVAKHEARLSALLGPADRAALLRCCANCEGVLTSPEAAAPSLRSKDEATWASWLDTATRSYHEILVDQNHPHIVDVGERRAGQQANPRSFRKTRSHRCWRESRRDEP